MTVWRQVVAMAALAATTAYAVDLAAGPASHRVNMRKGVVEGMFICLVIQNAIDFVDPPARPLYLQIAAALATAAIVVALPIAWRKAGREQP